MKVHVITVSGANVAKVLTTFGGFSVRWGDGMPVQNQDYDVELEIEDTPPWRAYASPESVKSCYSIREEDDAVVLTGVVESIDADGYAALRIGGFIVPVMLGKNFESLKPGFIVEVRTKTIVAYPVYY